MNLTLIFNRMTTVLVLAETPSAATTSLLPPLTSSPLALTTVVLSPTPALMPTLSTTAAPPSATSAALVTATSACVTTTTPGKCDKTCCHGYAWNSLNCYVTSNSILSIDS